MLGRRAKVTAVQMPWAAMTGASWTKWWREMEGWARSSHEGMVKGTMMMRRMTRMTMTRMLTGACVTGVEATPSCEGARGEDPDTGWR